MLTDCALNWAPSTDEPALYLHCNSSNSLYTLISEEEGKMLCRILIQAMKSGHDECRITAHKGEEKAAEQPLTASVAMVCPPPGLGGSAGQAQMLWECKPD